MIENILEKETNIYEVAISIKFKIIRNWPIHVMPHSPSQHSLLFARHWVSPDVPTSADFKVSFLNPAFLFLFSAPVLLHSTLRIQSVRAALGMSFTHKSKYFSPHIVHSFPRESRDSISLPIGMLDSLTGI